MAQVLAEMSVVAEASAARLGDVVHGGERNQRPKGTGVSMAEEHARAYRRANGPLARRAALREAREALIRAKLAPVRDLVPETLEWRVAIGRAAGSVEQVSIRFGVSRSTVYRMRQAHSGPAA